MELFEEMHKILRQGNGARVLSELLSDGGDKICPPYDQDENHAWYLVGDIQFKAGDFHSSIESFKRSLASRENDAEALWGIASCYSELEEPCKSVQYLKKALSVGRKDIFELLTYDLGNAYFDQKLYAQAIKEYSKISSTSDIYERAKKNLELAKENLENEKN